MDPQTPVLNTASETALQAPAAPPDYAGIAKQTASDAWLALRTVLADPINGVQTASESLPAQRRLFVSATYGVGLFLAFAVGLSGLIQSAANAVRSVIVGAMGVFGSGISSFSLSAGERASFGIIALLILAGFVGTSYGLRRMEQVEGSVRDDLFAAATATLPITLFLLPVGLLSISSPWLIIPLATFTVAYSVMLLFGGLRGVAGLRPQRAMLGVPLAYIAADVLLYIAFLVLA